MVRFVNLFGRETGVILEYTVVAGLDDLSSIEPAGERRGSQVSIAKILIKMLNSSHCPWLNPKYVGQKSPADALDP